jgi:ribosomal protein L30E
LSTENHITANCTISDHQVCKNGEILFTGEQVDLPGFLVAIYQKFGLSYTRFYKMDNLSKLGWLASELLLKDSFNKKDHLPEETAIVLANANSSLDSDLKYMASVADIPSPSLFVYTLPNIMIGEICIRNNFKGEAAFFVSEAFDVDFMEQYVNNLFNTNNLKACICGWVDVIGNEYKAVLFLVEKGKGKIVFDKERMNNIFENR